MMCHRGRPAVIVPGMLATFMAVSCAAQAAKRIPIQVLEPAERAWVVKEWPVTFGMVFPDGELAAIPGGRVVDGRGANVPFEAEVTGWWNPEKTRPKWLLLHFKANTDQKYFFEVGAMPTQLEGGPLAKKTDGGLLVDTGPLQLRLDEHKPSLFTDVMLNGRSMLSPVKAPLTLTALGAEGTTAMAGRLGDWKVVLEEVSPLRTSVKATGLYRLPDGKPIARVSLRYLFAKGEAFVRLYHTLTWMVRDPKVGVRVNALTLRPAVSRQLHIGLSESGDRELRPSLRPGDAPETDMVIRQDTAEHFAVSLGAKVLHEGAKLGGWVALSDGEGRQVSVSVRHAAQMFPMAFRYTPADLSVEFCPSAGPRLSFMPRGIMPQDFFNSPVWKRFWYARKAGHHVNEYSVRRKKDGTIVPSPYFVYTAEGAARTHELIVGFHDKQTRRKPAELNALNQHPVLLRQDPSWAMRVPFMGLSIMPVKKDKYPNIERALDMLSRLPFARFAKQHDFGYLRFGKVVWGDRPHPNTSIYRWMDNVQYDQQLLPWLFFMRGGDRRLYEDGEIVGRYAMDINTNHYNTRNMPTGYQATCGGGMPFPFLGMLFWNQKGQKIHFLAYYYHLTGYKRAKEVMDEIIAGTKTFVLARSDKTEERHSSGREIYNMNMFWCNAWEETWDPEIKQLLDESRRVTATREYHRKFNTFRPPQVYLYMGMLFQHHLSKGPVLAEVMERHLAADMLHEGEKTGVYSVENTAGCPWAFERTGDMRYARAGWDVARRLADLVSEADLSGERPPQYTIRGNMFYRHFILPILTNVSMADRLGIKESDPLVFRDLFVYLERGGAGGKEYTAAAYVRARKDGDLTLPVVVRQAPGVPIAVMAADAGNARLAELTLKAAKSVREGRWWSRVGREADGALVIPGARKGAVYKVTFRTQKRNATAMLLGDADIVFHLQQNAWHAVQPLSGGQGYSGVRFFTKTTKEEFTFTVDNNIFHRPHTIRDAATGELLHRHRLGQPLGLKHKLGKGRLLAILMGGQRAARGWKADGLAPYVSATKDGWFDPSAYLRPNLEKPPD